MQKKFTKLSRKVTRKYFCGSDVSGLLIFVLVSEKTTEDYSDGTYCSFPIIFCLYSFSFPAKNRLFSAG